MYDMICRDNMTETNLYLYKKNTTKELSLMVFFVFVSVKTCDYFLFKNRSEDNITTVPITQYIGNTSVFLPEFVMIPTVIQPTINVAQPAFHKLNVILETLFSFFNSNNKAEGKHPSKSGKKNIYFI